MRYKYCPECGTKLTEIHAGDDGMVPYCESCGKRWFDSFHSCVIVLIYNEYDEIVLSRQGHLSRQYATLTSGFITPGETAEDCAIREVKEEIGYAHKQELVLSEEVDSAEWVPALDAPKTMFPGKPGVAIYEVYHKFLRMRKLER